MFTSSFWRVPLRVNSANSGCKTSRHIVAHIVRLRYSVVNCVDFQDEVLVKVFVDLFKLSLGKISTPSLLREVVNDFPSEVFVDQTGGTHFNAGVFFTENICERALMVIKPKFLRLVGTTDIANDIKFVNVVLSASSENDGVAEFVCVEQHGARNNLVTVERAAMGTNSHFARSFCLSKGFHELFRVVCAQN